MSRSSSSRKAALEKLFPMYEPISGEILEEVQRCNEACEKRPWLKWLKLRPLVGYTSACASLHRTMEQYVLPEQAGSTVLVEQRKDDDDTQRVRYVLRDQATSAADSSASGAGKEGRARALLILLRQLLGSTAWSLEAGAASAMRQEQTDSFAQWLKRTPDLETPKYKVLFKGSSFEVREYEPYSVVETGSDAGVGNGSFFSLANYIFGKTNARNEKMAMTTPVQMDKKRGVMSFIMPSNYWGDALSDAPPPVDSTAVRLQSRPSELVAVSIFGGYARGAAVDQKTEELLAAVEADGRLEVVDRGDTRLMQYNDPFTVPWKRRNEVSVPVRTK